MNQPSNSTSLTSITVENFKSICGEQRIDFRPITLLFGPNSAGKSTVLQALQFMREILERGNVDPDRTIAGGDSIDLGGFRNLVHNHDLSKPVEIRVDFTPGDDPLPSKMRLTPGEDAADSLKDFAENGVGAVGSAWIKVVCRWDADTERACITHYEVGIDGRTIATITDVGKLLPCITSIDFGHPLFRDEYDDDATDEEDGAEGIYREMESMVRRLFPDPLMQEPGNDIRLIIDDQPTAVPDFTHPLNIIEDAVPAEEMAVFEQLRLVLDQILVGTGSILLRELKRLRYLGPIRSVPPRNFVPRTSPDDARWASGLAAWDLLYKHYDHDTRTGDVFFKRICQAISSPDELGLGYSIELSDYYELRDDSVIMNHLRATTADDSSLNGELFLASVRRELDRLQPQRRLILRDEINDTEVKPQDIGVGISQVMPVVVGTMEPNCSLFAVEQPELHVHPRIQCGLGDIFGAEACLGDGRVFLIETHSEHLILRLLRRIRETSENELPPGKPPLTPDQVSVYYVQGGENGMQLTDIPIAPDGDFTKQWPDGFFEEREEELF